MLRIFVCDDNNAQREEITKIIDNYIIMEELDMEITLSVVSPVPIIEYLEKHPGKSGNP